MVSRAILTHKLFYAYTLALLLLPALAYAAPTHEILRTAEPVLDYAVEDINGDSMKDLIVLSGEDKVRAPKKYLEVFLAGADQRYPQTPSFSMPMTRPWSMYFFAETDGEAPRELVAVNGEGVTIFRFTEGTLVADDAISIPSLYPTSNKGARFLSAATDLDGDGVEEWLAPTAHGFSARNATTALAQIPCDVENYANWDDEGRMAITHRFPAFKILDLPEEGKAISFLTNDQVEYFTGEGWQEKQAHPLPPPEDEDWRTDTYMEDVQGNGYPDVIISRVKGSLSVESELLLYIAREDGTYTETPSSRYYYKGDYVYPALLDIDGDKNKDLILIKVTFGVKNLVSYFMQHKISVVAEGYLFDGNGFPKQPDFQTKLTMEAPEDSDSMAYAMGDFNADGRLDVAFGKGKESIMVHLGEKGKFISSKVWKKLKLPADGRARKVQLDENEADDLIVIHHNLKRQQRIDVIRF